MTEAKLEKVNKRLYHEPSKDETPRVWNKSLNLVSLTLNEVRVELCLKIDRPETSIREFSKAVKELRNEDGETGKDEAFTTSEEKGEMYSQDFGWRIVAKGCLDHDRIGLIGADGSVSDWARDFDSVEVFLSSIADSQKETSGGTIFYSDAKYEKGSEPYLCLDLQVPEIQLEKFCSELSSGRINKLSLRVVIDTFESQLDRSLWEPPAPRRFYVEEDSICRAYLSDLIGSRSLAKT